MNYIESAELIMPSDYFVEVEKLGSNILTRLKFIRLRLINVLDLVATLEYNKAIESFHITTIELEEIRNIPLNMFPEHVQDQILLVKNEYDLISTLIPIVEHLLKNKKRDS